MRGQASSELYFSFAFGIRRGVRGSQISQLIKPPICEMIVWEFNGMMCGSRMLWQNVKIWALLRWSVFAYIAFLVISVRNSVKRDTVTREKRN